jgi:SAM-dependent methyltransferase
VADERDLRLLGSLNGRRALLLGCGGGQAAATLALAGARVIAVDGSPDSVAATRRVAAARGVAVDAQQRDLAELAFVRAETIDVAVSLLSLAEETDPARVFRQAYRVLRPEAPIIMSLPHPALAMTEAGSTGSTGSAPDDAGDAVRLLRPYGDVSGEAPRHGGADVEVRRPHTIEALVTALVRAGFRLDTLLELMARRPDRRGVDQHERHDVEGQGPLDPGAHGQDAYWQRAMALVPAVLVIRARKTGL